MYPDETTRILHQEIGAGAGNLEVVKQLLESGVSVESADDFNVRPIHLAAARGFLEMVELFIAYECDVNVQTAYSTASEQQESMRYAEYMRYTGSHIGVTPLHLAAQYGHLHVAMTLVAATADVNAEDSMKETPLFYAVAQSHEVIATFLILKGASVNARNLSGSTPLHRAAERGNLSIILLLLQNKAAINAKNLRGLTPLQMSLISRQAEVAKFLVNRGADVNAWDNDGRTPLFNGAKNGFPAEVARLLVSHGASVNVTDRSGRSALHLAAAKDYVDIASFLTQCKAVVNVADEQSWTPLHYAAYEGNFEIVNNLIVMGAKFEARTDRQATPLHLAAHQGHAHVVTLLVAHGADVHAADDVNWTALHYAADQREVRRSLGELESQVRDFKWVTIKSLIETGADVNAKGSNEETALHVALKYGDEVTITYLLENGAYYDATISSYFGSSAVSNLTEITRDESIIAKFIAIGKLFDAVKRADCVEIEKCIKERAPINSRSTKYETPLTYACWKGQLSVVRVLLANDVNVNLSNSSGVTPLHFAAKFGHSEILRTLLQHGAVYNARTRPGRKTPFHFAQEIGRKVIADTLAQIERIFIRVSICDKTVLKDLTELKDTNHELFLAIKNCRNADELTLSKIASKNGLEEICDLFGDV